MVEYNRFGFRIVTEETREKMRRAKLGNENGAGPYPAFINRKTGEVIPAGVNLSKMCRERGLCRTGMKDVKLGRRRYHKGWILYDL